MIFCTSYISQQVIQITIYSKFFIVIASLMGICNYEIKRVHVEYESCLLRQNCKWIFNKFLNTDISITSCNTNLNNYIGLIFFQFNTTKNTVTRKYPNSKFYKNSIDKVNNVFRCMIWVIFDELHFLEDYIHFILTRTSFHVL